MQKKLVSCPNPKCPNVKRQHDPRSAAYAECKRAARQDKMNQTAKRNMDKNKSDQPPVEWDQNKEALKRSEESAKLVRSVDRKLRENPGALVDDQERVAEALHSVRARTQVRKARFDSLQAKVRDSFTDRQIANGDFKVSEDGQMFVTVQEEQINFDSKRAGLTDAEARECSDSKFSPKLAREKFPETWNAIGSCSGEVYVQLPEEESDGERLETEVRALVASSPMKKPRKASELVSQFLQAEKEYEKAKGEEEKFRGRVSAAANSIMADTFGENMSLLRKGEQPLTEGELRQAMVNKGLSGKWGSTGKNPGGFSLRPHVSHSTGDFVTEREMHYLQTMKSADPDKVGNLARQRAMKDAASIREVYVKASEVQKRYPAKYQAGKPLEKQIYIGEMG